jgi:ABC-type Co2+ transport system permease subunit
VDKPARWRFLFGSAAIFWLALALLVWFGFFIAFRREQSEVRWFFSSYFAAPAFATFLLSLLIINITRSTPHAWVISAAGFLLIGYLMLLWLGPHLIVGAH